MEEPKKKTQIIVITDNTEYGTCAEAFGAKVAEIFKASLLIKPYQQIGNKEYFLHQAESADTSMLVIGVDKNHRKATFTLKKALKFMKDSRIPILVVGKELPKENQFQNVLLPIDIEKNTKEKALWAGYFSRYYGATIHILYNQHKDEFLQKEIQDNLDFIHKLYNNLEINYKDHLLTDKNHCSDLASLSFAPQVNATLTVIMLTQYYSLIDWLFSPKEKEILQKAENFPVLCLNARDDLYVLCT